MVQKVIWTGYQECQLEILVKTSKKEKIHLRVQDEKQAYTAFTDRFAEVNGTYLFIVKMPLTGWNAIAFLWNAEDELNPNDQSFQVVNMKKTELEKRMDYVDVRNPFVKSFMQFGIKQFCYNAGILKPDMTYTNGTFRIDYLTVLTNGEGDEVDTPCRISADEDRIMQASQKFFKEASVPGRAALMCHEFAHGYINKDSKDKDDEEIKADLNGLSIYLGMGFPRIEAEYVFLDTFYGERSSNPKTQPSELNQTRLKIIRDFINEFETEKVTINEF